MTAWRRLPIEERMRIRKEQTFNVVDLAFRVVWSSLLVVGFCILTVAVAVLVYDIVFLRSPWWLTCLGIVVLVLVVGRRRRRT